MTQSEKLQKVIEKAYSKGLSGASYIDYKESIDCDYPYRWTGDEMFFNHDFAKAFWGDREVCDYCGSGAKYAKGLTYSECCSEWTYSKAILAWKYYIQELALTPEEQRINYLYLFI